MFTHLITNSLMLTMRLIKEIAILVLDISLRFYLDVKS